MRKKYHSLKHNVRLIGEMAESSSEAECVQDKSSKCLVMTESRGGYSKLESCQKGTEPT